MNMKLYLSLVSVMLCAVAFAQPKFVPETEIMKLGEIPFQQPKTVTLGFVNKGNKPLSVLKATPSCGCMAVSVPKSPINAGGRGMITIQYDAKMMGSFYKDVEILTNASDDPVYLAIQGTVVADVKDYGQDFPIDLGNVRLLSNYVEFDDVHKGEHPYVDIKLVNTEKTAYRPTLMHLPDYLTAQYMPEDIPAGKTGVIRLTLDSDQLMHMGLTQTSVYLSRYLGDKVSETNEILVSSVLLPDFSNLAGAEGQPVPELSLSETEFDYNPSLPKQKPYRIVMLTNNGSAPLHIQQVQVFSKALSVSLNNSTLAPGKTAKMKIMISNKYLYKAKSRPRVLLITDDPKHAKQIININIQE